MSRRSSAAYVFVVRPIQTAQPTISHKETQMTFVRKFSNVVLILAGVLCMSPARPSLPQGNGTQHSSGAFSVTFVNDCTGELVDIDVTYKSDIHVVADKAGGFHVDVHDVYSGRGVGQTSGTNYNANQTDSFSL